MLCQAPGTTIKLFQIRFNQVKALNDRTHALRWNEEPEINSKQLGHLLGACQRPWSRGRIGDGAVAATGAGAEARVRDRAEVRARVEARIVKHVRLPIPDTKSINFAEGNDKSHKLCKLSA